MSINEGCMEMTLNSPITEEQWDAITDVDFEHTNRIWFHTKHGKDVEFAKVVHGHWIDCKGSNGKYYRKCSVCLHTQEITGVLNYCSICGARMGEVVE